METMKAAFYSRYGGPEVLELLERPKPTVKKNCLLVRVRAAEVTKGDCELRRFQFPVKWFSWALRVVWGLRRPRRGILGGYFAGTVEAVGEGVTKFEPGQDVFGATKLLMGSHAEYLLVPDHYTVTKKPHNLSFEEAAAVPLGALNALHFLKQAEIKAGENLLINGAGGSIGTFALQIAKAWGAQVSVVDAAHKKQFLLDLGADQFIDYQQSDFRQADERYDVLFDMVASSPLEASLVALKEGGRYITANPSFRKMIGASSTFKKTGKKVVFAFAGETLEELEEIREMIEAGAIRPAVDKVFPLAQVVEAHRRVEEEQRHGIVVLSMQ